MLVPSATDLAGPALQQSRAQTPGQACVKDDHGLTTRNHPPRSVQGFSRAFATGDNRHQCARSGEGDTSRLRGCDGSSSIGRLLHLVRWPFAALALLAAPSCGREARDIGPSVPQTPPRSAGDPRVAYFQSNAYQVAQGGRYFGWYGCGGCHREGASGTLELSDGRWRHGAGFDRVYWAIADGHGRLRYGRHIPSEQLWQITAYVRDLPLHTPGKRRRQSVDQVGEPRGASWSGPIR